MGGGGLGMRRESRVEIPALPPESLSGLSSPGVLGGIEAIRASLALTQFRLGL